MSENLYNECVSKKVLVKVDNANHGTSYLEDEELYISELNKFFTL